MRRFVSRVTIATLISAFALTAQAQVKPEEAYQYRKSAYHVLVWNWMPLVNMVRGKTPYDKAKFEMYANRVSSIAPTLLEGFPKGSLVKGSESRPEIWTNWSDFTLKMKNFEKESARLVSSAKTADFEKIKVQFQKVGGTCKDCHDNYKAE